MSKYYAESNNESTIKLFNKRKVYGKIRPSMRAKGYTNVKDFNFGEMCYYGKMDNYFSPIYVPPDSSFIERIPGTPAEEQLECFNFVADLFGEMSREFEKCAARGQIKQDDPYLSNLKVYKAFHRPTDGYDNYMQIFKAKLNRLFKSKDIQVENFSHFLEEFMKVFPHLVKGTPFTFTSYIKSRFNNIMASGLALEIADLPYDNDDNKQKMFVESPNWEFFVNACNKYGFVIDSNIPWRIVSDIKAREIQQYIQAGGLTSANLMLNDGSGAFQKASFETLSKMPALLLEIYNSVKKESFVKTKICEGTKITEVVTPESYTLQTLRTYLGFPDSLIFSKLYILMRLHEENVDINEQQKRLLVKDLLKHIKMMGNPAPIEIYFERFLSKPLDKPFTINYYYSIVRPAKMNRAFSRGDILSMPVDQNNLNNY
jgi:hypothetical protein